MNVSARLQSLPPYLFVEIDKAKRKAKAEGRDVIDLGIGDPDQPTPAHIIRSLQTAAEDPANHRYALDAGMPALREEIVGWFSKRFGVLLPILPATPAIPSLIMTAPRNPSTRSSVLFHCPEASRSSVDEVPLGTNQLIPWQFLLKLG